MDYRLELLNSTEFENLVNIICQRILGTGVIAFAPGKDGGRDGKFNGTARNYPSDAVCWQGKFIIQAKHALSPVASCSERDFETEVVDKEIPKISKLRAANDVDHYLLFTNRKYSGVKGEEICRKIVEKTKVDNSVIIGKEVINDLYLNQNKDIVRQFGLDKHHLPFDFSDQEIKDVIIAFKSHLVTMDSDLAANVEQVKYDYDKIGLEKKNNKNLLSKTYFEEEILARSLVEFGKIQRFLDNPANSDIKDVYFDIASELRQVITLQRDNFGAFEEIFYYIYKSVNDGDTLLKGSRRHLNTLLHYMYSECLIGRK